MIYLDNSATSRFKPCDSEKIAIDLLYNSANAGRGGHNDGIKLGKRIFDSRERVKQLVNANEDYEVIYTSNCTEALNLGILGYIQNLPDKIHVITTVNEHNSVLRPLQKLENLGKISVTHLVPNNSGVITSSAVELAVRKNTKLVIINHTSNVTGATSDIYEIGKVCRSHNIPLMVDGAQSLGHIAIDAPAGNVAMLAAAGHKGLHGVQGMGFLLVRNDITLAPIKFGGTGTDSQSLEQPSLLPEALESGTINSFGILLLDNGIKWTMENFQPLHHTYRYLSSELLYGLRHINGVQLYSQYPSSVVSFNVQEYSSHDVADYLNEHDIAVRSGLHCAPLIHRHLGTLERGAIRASIGYNNTIKDIKVLLQTIEDLVKI